ncbi:MAG TPA: ABC transporter permease, partial [Frankiaceae bacterium]|nr:ABC transporter permease [Frankiaceae bacterium]
PLPVWRTPFQYGVFVRAALLGLVLPVLAVAYPVWRAVRAEPVDAIRVTAVAGRTGRLGALLRRLPLPGGSIPQLPLRNAVRVPRRTVLTALGIGAVLTALVAFTGMLDTFTRTVDRAERELTRSAPDRLTLTLSGVQPVDAPAVTALPRSPAVAAAEPGLQLPGTLRNGARKVDVVTEIVDLRRGMWVPTTVRGNGTGGLVLAEKAAGDLGVHPGDTVVLRHPRRVGAGCRMVDTRCGSPGCTPSPSGS